MAGSWYHIVSNETGEFLGTELIENLGDAHEALEECYWIIRLLSGEDQDKAHEAQEAFYKRPAGAEDSWPGWVPCCDWD